MKEKLKKQEPPAFVDSAGLINFHEGEQPDHRSISIARKHGIDITVQRARMFSDADFSAFDFIFPMDTTNRTHILSMAKSPEDKQKVHLLLDFAGMGSNRSVPDPYYGNMHDFEKVFLLLDQACEHVAAKLQKVQAGLKTSE